MLDLAALLLAFDLTSLFSAYGFISGPNDSNVALKVSGLSEVGVILSFKCELGFDLSTMNKNIAEHSPKNENQANATLAYVYFSLSLLLKVSPPTTSGPKARPMF